MVMKCAPFRTASWISTLLVEFSYLEYRKPDESALFLSAFMRAVLYREHGEEPG